MHNYRFPNESPEYRGARDELLQAEIDLRKHIEEIAELRRQLPMGGELKEDYTFDEMTPAGPKQIKLSELFAPGKDSLIVYSFMYGPDDKAPCPMCTSLIDGFNGTASHVVDRVNFVVVGKSQVERLDTMAQERSWSNIRLLSSSNNTYNSDYFAESPEASQWPACNVFAKTADGIRHFYSTEVLYAKVDGQPRHVDLLWPMWNLFDMTPEGRGTDWYPKLTYS